MADPFLHQGDLCQLRVGCYAGNQAGYNILGYQADNVVGQPPIQTAVAAFSTALHTLYKALMPSAAEFVGCGLAVLTPVPTAEYVETKDEGVGTLGTDLAPTQVAGILTKRTGDPGRTGRGRAYIPFVPQQEVAADGSPTGTYRGALGNLAAVLKANVQVDDGAGNTCDMVPKLFAANLAAFRQIEDVVARSRFGTQRSRGEYGATNPRPFG